MAHSSRRRGSKDALLDPRDALVLLIAVLFSALLGVLTHPAGGDSGAALAAVGAFPPALVAVHKLIK